MNEDIAVREDSDGSSVVASFDEGLYKQVSTLSPL